MFNTTSFNGNKFKAEKLVYKSLKKFQKDNKKKNFKKLVTISIVNSSPVFYFKTVKRKRRKPVEFPFVLSKKLRLSYGLKFILNFCNKFKKESFYKRLNKEMYDSSKKSSLSFNKTENIYKEAFIKKKFSNYRWFY